MTDVHLPALLSDSMGISAATARRLIAQGAVSLNSEMIEDLDLPTERVNGQIRIGKNRFLHVRHGVVQYKRTQLERD